MEKIYFKMEILTANAAASGSDLAAARARDGIGAT
jgi:hypothetical protein